MTRLQERTDYIVLKIVTSEPIAHGLLKGAVRKLLSSVDTQARPAVTRKGRDIYIERIGIIP